MAYPYAGSEFLGGTGGSNYRDAIYKSRNTAKKKRRGPVQSLREGIANAHKEMYPTRGGNNIRQQQQAPQSAMPAISPDVNVTPQNAMAWRSRPGEVRNAPAFPEHPGVDYPAIWGPQPAAPLSSGPTIGFHAPNAPSPPTTTFPMGGGGFSPAPNLNWAGQPVQQGVDYPAIWGPQPAASPQLTPDLARQDFQNNLNQARVDLVGAYVPQKNLNMDQLRAVGDAINSSRYTGVPYTYDGRSVAEQRWYREHGMPDEANRVARDRAIAMATAPTPEEDIDAYLADERRKRAMRDIDRKRPGFSKWAAGLKERQLRDEEKRGARPGDLFRDDRDSFRNNPDDSYRTPYGGQMHIGLPEGMTSSDVMDRRRAMRGQVDDSGEPIPYGQLVKQRKDTLRERNIAEGQLDMAARAINRGVPAVIAADAAGLEIPNTAAREQDLALAASIYNAAAGEVNPQRKRDMLDQANRLIGKYDTQNPLASDVPGGFSTSPMQTSSQQQSVWDEIAMENPRFGTKHGLWSQREDGTFDHAGPSGIASALMNYSKMTKGDANFLKEYIDSRKSSVDYQNYLDNVYKKYSRLVDEKGPYSVTKPNYLLLAAENYSPEVGDFKEYLKAADRAWDKSYNKHFVMQTYDPMAMPFE